MTLQEAINEESRRYDHAVTQAVYARALSQDENERARWIRIARRHLLARRRLQHYALTEHEQLRHAVGH